MTDPYGALIAIDYLLSIASGLAALLIVWGFWPLALAPRSTPGVRSLARAILLITAAMGARSAWWALVAQDVRAAIGKAPPNILFASLLLWGAWYIFRVLHLTIPEGERQHYSLLTAPFYPRRWRALLAATFDAFLTRLGRD